MIDSDNATTENKMIGEIQPGDHYERASQMVIKCRLGWRSALKGLARLD